MNKHNSQLLLSFQPAGGMSSDEYPALKGEIIMDPEQTEKDRQIQAEINTLAEAMDGLSKRIGILSLRLIPALREKDPDNEEKGSETEISLVKIANHIRRVRYTVKYNIGKLNDIIERLEI